MMFIYNGLLFDFRRLYIVFTVAFSLIHYLTKQFYL